MAQNITFADPDATVHKDIVMYGVNITSGYFEQLAVYNTTTTGIYLSNSSAPDVMFVVKPQYSNPLDEPQTWLSSTFSYVQTNVVSLLIIMFLIGLILTRK